MLEHELKEVGETAFILIEVWCLRDAHTPPATYIPHQLKGKFFLNA